MNTSTWSVSGLCVTTRPEDVAEVESSLNLRSNTEVHARDPHSGRLVVVQECATVEDHRKSLREIQALPGVMYAELVLHYQEPDTRKPTPTTGGA